MNLTATINAVSVGPLMEGSKVKRVRNGVGQATLVFLEDQTFSAAHRDKVVIKDGATNIFTGFVDTIDKATVESAGLLRLSIRCLDYVALLNEKTLDGNYDNQTTRAIIQDLITRAGLASDIGDNDADIDIVGSNLDLSMGETSVREWLDELAGLREAGYFIDGDGDLHFNTDANGGAAGFDVSDVPTGTEQKWINLATRSTYSKPVREVTVIGGFDISGNRVKATRTSAGTPYTGKPGGNTLQRTVRNDRILTTAMAEDLGDTILAIWEDPRENAKFSVDGHDGLDVNQLIDITSRLHSLTAVEYIINAITMRQQVKDGAMSTWYDVECGPDHTLHERRLRRFELLAAGRADAPINILGVQFNGSNEYFRETTVPASLDNLAGSTDGFTVSFKFRLDDLTGTQVFIEKEDGWRIQESGDNVQVVVTLTSGTRTFTNSITLEVDKTYIVTVTFAGDVSAGDVKILVNGQGTTSGGGSGTPNDEGTATDINVARDHNNSNYLDGWLADICIWNRVLGQNDLGTIVANPNGSATGAIAPANQLIRWRLDTEPDGNPVGTGDVVDEWNLLSPNDVVNTAVAKTVRYIPE